MAYQKESVIIFVILAVLVFVSAKPKDATVFNDLVANADVAIEKSAPKTDLPDVKVPGRIPCEFEEATETRACQAHCLPKGYSYGICVSKTCSCI